MKQFYVYLGVLSALLTGSTAYAYTPVTAVTGQKAEKAQQLKTFDTDRTVLAQKQMAPGVIKRVVRDAQGRVFHDLVRDGKVTAAPQTIRKPFRTADNTSFFEGFEGHTGQLDWLPDGWVEINTEANIPTEEMCRRNINNSWSVQDTGDGYWTDITTDGVKQCWIHFTYAWSYNNDEGETISGGPDPQDEWAITPAITVGDGHDLFFIAEVDLGSLYSFDWNTSTYDRSSIEQDFEVLVSTDNGANWTSLWKATSDVCSGMTDDEMYDCMGELKFKPYHISLAAYSGQEVKIAFRYTNIGDGWSGNSASFDAVTVGAPAAEAFYNLPDGTLLFGVSEGLHVNTESYCLMPAWTPITWNAASNNYTENNTWNFYDLEGNATSYPGNSVEMEYAWSEGAVVAYPSLTASNAKTSHTYSYDGNDAVKGGMVIGGKAPLLVDETVYLGNYDYQHKHLITPYLAQNAYCFGTSPAGTWGEGFTQTAVGNLFYAPAAPLTVEDVMLTLGELDADADAVFTLEIFEVNESGQVSATPVATSTLTAGEIDGFGFYNAVFHLPTPYVMKGHTLMMVKGFADNSKVRTFAACAQTDHNDANHNYAYMKFTNPQGQSVLYAASDALQDYSSALYLSLNGTFHFLRLNEEIVDMDTSTDSVIVDAVASNAPENWYVVDGENIIPLTAEGTVYDWLRITPVTKEDGSYAVLFSADPVTASRAKTVVLSNDGGQARIRVRQGISVGIDTAIADTDQAVEIFDLQGRRVAGSADNLIPGIYIVRQGGQTRKAVIR